MRLAGTLRFVVIFDALVEKGNECDSGSCSTLRGNEAFGPSTIELICDEEEPSDISNPSSQDAGAYIGYRKLLQKTFWQQRLDQSGSEAIEKFGVCSRH